MGLILNILITVSLLSACCPLWSTAYARNTPPSRRSVLATCPTSTTPVLAFGDSTSDTGNAVLANATGAPSIATRPPYGHTFFNMPTGRFSDGRLMVDFLCAALKVPFLPPHLNRTASCNNENFAVAGATVLDPATLQKLANVTPFTPDSLGVQMEWFTADTENVDLSKALVYFGEIGGNDYNYALAARESFEVVNSLIDPVIQNIATSIEAILSRGVKKVVIQGQFPMGCISLYLMELNNTQHDEHGCVAEVMALSKRHNELLRGVLVDMAKKHPEAELVFFDTSAAYLHILDSAQAYNFTNVQDPCFTGALALLVPPPATNSTVPPPPPPPMTTCPNPQNYVSWDGIHLTDAMYGALMSLFLSSPQFTFPFPNFLSTPSC